MLCKEHNYIIINIFGDIKYMQYLVNQYSQSLYKYFLQPIQPEYTSCTYMILADILSLEAEAKRKTQEKQDLMHATHTFHLCSNMLLLKVWMLPSPGNICNTPDMTPMILPSCELVACTQIWPHTLNAWQDRCACNMICPILLYLMP